MKVNDADIMNAVTALRKYEVVQDNAYDREFNGYISSFGASILQAGLLPTVTFFSEKGGAEKDRDDLLLVMMEMIRPKAELQKYTVADVYTYVADPTGPSKRKLEKLFLNKAIAVKLALRLFKKK